MSAPVIDLARHRTFATIPVTSPSTPEISSDLEAFQHLENALQLAKFYARRGDFSAASRKTVQALKALKGLRSTAQQPATARG